MDLQTFPVLSKLVRTSSTFRSPLCNLEENKQQIHQHTNNNKKKNHFKKRGSLHMVSISHPLLFTDTALPTRGKTGRQSMVFKDLPLKFMNQETIPQKLIAYLFFFFFSKRNKFQPSGNHI